jgi:hypothetical protein
MKTLNFRNLKKAVAITLSSLIVFSIFSTNVLADVAPATTIDEVEHQYYDNV